MKFVRPEKLPTNHYAGLVTRSVAIGIDAIVLTVVVSIGTAIVGLILSLFTKVDTGSGLAVLGTLGSWALIVAAYFTFSWTAAGQTLGQHVMQIRVQRIDGARIGLIRSYVRFLGLSVCVPLFPTQLLVLFTPRRRAPQDLVARTVVVYTDAVGHELPHDGGTETVVDATVVATATAELPTAEDGGGATTPPAPA